MSAVFGQTSGSSVFGQNNNQQQQNKPSLFGSLNTDTPASQASSSGGLFGSSQPQQSSGLFGSLSPNATTSQPQQTGGLFGSLNTNATTSQPPQGGGLFGSLNTNTTTSQSQQGGGLFGSAQPQQSSGGLFGSAIQPQQSSSGLFGSQQQQPQQSSLFGSLGSTTNQQPQQGGGLFGSLGSTTNQQPQQQNQSQYGGGLFGGFGQGAQQQQNAPQGSMLGQTQGLFQQSQIVPQKSVIHQIELAYAKWNPQSPVTLFQAYLYNTVPPDQAPFYGPTAQDDESKWEEALSKKPSPGAVPVLVRGFDQIAARMKMQVEALTVLRGRLHEINDGLNTLLQKHDLQISVRAAECKGRHLKLSHQCLGLAAKTQLLRNRGYAMDSAEEELRKKLLVLERSVFDPALNGRSEEIWARMVSVRERERQLRREFEKAGRGLSQQKDQVIDEEVMKRAKKILEDYNSQISHLSKELKQIQKDWEEWEQSQPPAIANGTAR